MASEFGSAKYCFPNAVSKFSVISIYKNIKTQVACLRVYTYSICLHGLQCDTESQWVYTVNTPLATIPCSAIQQMMEDAWIFFPWMLYKSLKKNLNIVFCCIKS